MPGRENHIAVIGGGIVGICCALAIRKRGFQVTLIDRSPPCTGTSRGSAGAIAVAETMPLASPGIMAKAPGWLLDPLGPLSVRPAYLPTLIPWLYRFWRASSHAQVRKSAVALTSLMDISVAAWQEMAADAGIADKLRTSGGIHVYEGQREFDASAPAWAMRKEMGVSFEVVEGKALQELEPALAPSFTHGHYVPDWIQVTDPYDIGVGLWKHALASGVAFQKAGVLEITPSGTGPIIHTTDARPVQADKAIIAAGAWSHRLAKQWGENIPLETERGYNTTFPNPNLQVKQQLTFAEHGFVISPLTSGLRIGGAVELAGLEAAPNFNRARAMVQKARRFLPELVPGEGKEWMGYRPSLPDSLPVISRSDSRSDIYYAFGHGHLGLTQAPSTANLVADLVCEREPQISLHPFRCSRF